MQFFFREEDVGKNRAEVTLGHLAELNSYVNMAVHNKPLNEEFVAKFQVRVTTIRQSKFNI